MIRWTGQLRGQLSARCHHINITTAEYGPERYTALLETNSRTVFPNDQAHMLQNPSNTTIGLCLNRIGLGNMQYIKDGRWIHVQARPDLGPMSTGWIHVQEIY